MSRKRSGFAITSVRGGEGGGAALGGGASGGGGGGDTEAGGSSRFRLVRLPTTGEPLRRGRWTCRDFYEPQAPPRVTPPHGTAPPRVPLSLDSRLPPHHPPPLQLHRTGGSPPPLRSVPPPAIEQGSGHLPRSLGPPEGRGLPGDFAHLVQQALPRSPPPPRPGVPPPPGGGTEGLSARLGLAGSGLGIGDDDGAGSGMIAIDNKIEQAMDLVKSHLLLAVREEVEALREHIKELSERQALLQRENGLLRALATPQQLARLRPPPPNQTGGPPA